MPLIGCDWKSRYPMYQLLHLLARFAPSVLLVQSITGPAFFLPIIWKEIRYRVHFVFVFLQKRNKYVFLFWNFLFNAFQLFRVIWGQCNVMPLILNLLEKFQEKNLILKQPSICASRRERKRERDTFKKEKMKIFLRIGKKGWLLFDVHFMLLFTCFCFTFSFLLFTLSIIVTSWPAWVHLHMQLAFLASLFIVFGLLFSA